MDIATILGIGGGFVMLVAALLVAANHGGGGVSMGQFVDWPAFIMVVGGGLCVVMTSVPLKVFLGLPKLIKRLVFNRPADHRLLMEQLVKLAEIARRDGLLILERSLPEIQHPTLRTVIQLAVDGARADVIQSVLRKEMMADESRQHVERKMFDMMGRCGPAFGMIATLLGLILMLGNLDDPDTIGPSMAMALVGTLYGAAMANMICMPCAEKIAYLGHHELLAKEMILEGVVALVNGESPRLIEQRLMSFLDDEHAPATAA
jgi:chemotaxis protein MotA